MSRALVLESEPTHSDDMAFWERWWLELKGELTDERVQRLEAWVKTHPKDAQSLYYLSRVEARKSLRDPEANRRCMRLTQDAANLGHPAAAAQLGWAMLTGDGIRRDPATADELLRKAVVADDTEAHAIYGMVRCFGLDGKAPDYTEAERHTRIAADRGYVRAWGGLWVVYNAAGRGREGLDFLTKGAEAGDPQARILLSKCYMEGQYVPRDLKQAERWAKLAAQGGNPEYQRTLGEIYKAIGTAEAKVEAMRWFALASQGGDMKARYYLGVIYTNGVGAAKVEPEEGLAMMRQAAEAGVPEAEGALAAQYMFGVLVERDVAEARRWYEKAAAHGQAEAKTMLQWLDYRERRQSDVGK